MNKFTKYIDDLELVRKRIHEIRDKYGIKNISENRNDVRYSFLNQLYRLIMSYDLGLVDFIKSTYKENKVKELFKIDDSFQTAEILLDYFNFLKLGFIYSLSSLSENYFRSIFRKLFEKEDSKKEFFEIRKRVFKELNINIESNYWKALSLLSNIRNCIHNNGIYYSSRENIEIEYHGVTYNFRNGEAQENSSPKELILILNDILSVVIEINGKVDYANDISYREHHTYKNLLKNIAGKI
jgi:hypothetical protein